MESLSVNILNNIKHSHCEGRACFHAVGGTFLTSGYKMKDNLNTLTVLGTNECPASLRSWISCSVKISVGNLHLCSGAEVQEGDQL